MSRGRILILNWCSLVWAVITPLTGLFADRLPDLVHPVWSLVTVPLMVILQALRIGGQEGTDKRAAKIDASRRYVIIFLLVLAFFSGLGTQMGLFSVLIHQIVVWPLLVYMVVDFVRTATAKSP